MAQSNGRSPITALRAAVNTPRASVIALVTTLSAAGGAIAGAVAALIAAAVLTPSEPVTVTQVALMALGYGLPAGIAGAILGTAVGFGALRRVPLGRLLLCTNGGLAAGLTLSWLAGPWAWHHMEWLGVLGFSLGAVAAYLLTRRRATTPSLRGGNVDVLDTTDTPGLAEPGPISTSLDTASPATIRRVDRGPSA